MLLNMKIIQFTKLSLWDNQSNHLVSVTANIEQRKVEKQDKTSKEQEK